MEQLHWITDMTGPMKGIRRQVTAAQYRAEINAIHAEASKIADAWKRGDHDGCAKAQADFRRKFA